MPLSDRYAVIAEQQKRQNTHAAQKRAQMKGRGITQPDDSEPPFDPNPDKVPAGMVRVRCLKRGNDKISMGITLPLEAVKYPNFHQGDTFVLLANAADKYENDDSFGWIEQV